MKAYYDKEPAIAVRASLEDFEGDVTKWKDSFYELWRYEMTWNFAYVLKVNEYSDKSVGVRIIARPAYKDALLDTMKHLGYRKITVDETAVAVISPYEYDMDGDLEIDASVIQW